MDGNIRAFGDISMNSERSLHFCPEWYLSGVCSTRSGTRHLVRKWGRAHLNSTHNGLFSTHSGTRQNVSKWGRAHLVEPVFSLCCQVNFVRGRPPVLTIYDKVSGEAEEKINLEKFNLEEVRRKLKRSVSNTPAQGHGIRSTFGCRRARAVVAETRITAGLVVQTVTLLSTRMVSVTFLTSLSTRVVSVIFISTLLSKRVAPVIYTTLFWLGVPSDVGTPRRLAGCPDALLSEKRRFAPQPRVGCNTVTHAVVLGAGDR